jgi:hypothetical protein
MNKNDLINKEIDKLQNETVSDMFKTSLKKQAFINEIKNGLGEEMKKNLNTIKVIKKPWYVKFKEFFTKLFKVI